MGFHREMHIFRPISIQMKLFESVFEPIYLYGSEVLGYENLNLVKQINKYKLICKGKHNMKVGATPFLYEDLDRECIYNLSKEEEKKHRMGSYWREKMN